MDDLDHYQKMPEETYENQTCEKETCEMTPGEIAKAAEAKESEAVKMKRNIGLLAGTSFIFGNVVGK